MIQKMAHAVALRVAAGDRGCEILRERLVPIEVAAESPPASGICGKPTAGLVLLVGQQGGHLAAGGLVEQLDKPGALVR